MNKHQKRCVHRAVCLAAIAAFTLGLCTGYFVWYADLNFKFIAICVGLVAVLISCGNGITNQVLNFLDFGRCQAHRNRNRIVRQARREFAAASRPKKLYP